MKKKLMLLILPLMLLAGCDKSYAFGPVKTENISYDKVHIYGVGCVDKKDTVGIWIYDANRGMYHIRYTNQDGDEFTTTAYAFVKGKCPICGE